MGQDMESLELELRDRMKRAKTLVEVLRKNLHDGMTDSLETQPPAWTWASACWNLLPPA